MSITSNIDVADGLNGDAQEVPSQSGVKCFMNRRDG